MASDMFGVLFGLIVTVDSTTLSGCMLDPLATNGLVPLLQWKKQDMTRTPCDPLS